MRKSAAPDRTKVGVIGLGRMGGAMAARVHAAGYDVLGYDVIEAARTRAGHAGARVAGSLAELAGSDVVLTSLPDTAAVESAYLGPDELLGLLRPGTVCADLSTISPRASARVAQAAAEQKVGFLDAPVSGTQTHVESGTAALYVGGDPADFKVIDPVLAEFASTRELIGPAGSGLKLKLVANRLLTTHLTAIAESIQELEALGIDTARGLRLLEQGAVPRLLSYKAPAMAARDWTPRFTIALMRKDLRLMDEEMPPGPLAALCLGLVESAFDGEMAESDIGSVLLQLPVRRSRDHDADRPTHERVPDDND